MGAANEVYTQRLADDLELRRVGVGPQQPAEDAQSTHQIADKVPRGRR